MSNLLDLLLSINNFLPIFQVKYEFMQYYKIQAKFNFLMKEYLYFCFYIPVLYISTFRFLF